MTAATKTRSRKTRIKPKSPEQIMLERMEKRALDLAAVNMPVSAAALDQHEDVEVTRAGARRDGKTVKHDVARRMDAFQSLREGMAPGAFDAARRLERDVLTSMGQSDHGRHSDRVDCDPSAVNRTDLMIQAADRVSKVLKRVSARDGWLLREIIYPQREYRSWREIVAYITGETHTHAQGAAVRAACVNLRDAYDVRPRQAA